MVDVITRVADGIATGQFLLSYVINVITNYGINVINGITKVADGIATGQFFYYLMLSFVIKKCIRHIFTDTLPCVYKIIKINIFFRPEEAMFGN